MDVTADSLKAWLADIGHDRHWLADEIGVSKRTLDNWFSDGFPTYAIKSISRLRKEIESKVPEIEESAIHLTISQWKELHRRSHACGFDDEMEFINAALREMLMSPFSGSLEALPTPSGVAGKTVAAVS